MLELTEMGNAPSVQARMDGDFLQAEGLADYSEVGAPERDLAANVSISLAVFLLPSYRDAGMSNKTRTRRKRRQANAAMKFGRYAAPRHKGKSGRTGGMFAKAIKFELPWWVGGWMAAWCAWIGRDKTPNEKLNGPEGRSP